MKKYLPFLSLAILIAACNSKPESNVKTLQAVQAPVADTAGLAAFQQWKAQNELATAAVPKPVQPTVTQTAPVKTVEIIREVRVEKPAPRRNTPKPAPVVNTPVEETTPAPEPQPTEAGASGSTESTASNEAKGPKGPEAGEASQPTAKKEGWSKAAKGAVIGGAGGAVLGAIINKKNPAAGAVIGGVLGGAVGYGVGKGKDKKDGRN